MEFNLYSLNKLPRESGVYVIRENGLCLYVGQSKNVYQRWNNTRGHHRAAQLKKEYPDCKIEFLPCPKEDLILQEKSYIKRLSPLLNGTVVIKGADRLVVSLPSWVAKRLSLWAHVKGTSLVKLASEFIQDSLSDNWKNVQTEVKAIAKYRGITVEQLEAEWLNGGDEE